jgi:glycosyltransferase involved in cell wall biosynthesis
VIRQPAVSGGDAPRVLYLSLETLRPGQASHTHVRTIADGLGAAGLPTRLIAQELAEGAPRDSRIGRLLRYLTLSLRGLAALRSVDVAYVRAHPAALPFSFVARLLGKPVVHEVNGRTADIGVSYGLPGWLTAGLNWVQIVQYRWAAGVVAVTPGLKAWLAAILGRDDTLHLVPNGADGALFRPDAPGGPQIDGDYALFFGGLVAWHGVETMLAAVRQPAWPAALRLVVVGDGQLAPQLRQAAAADPRILALGYLPKTELAGLAARAYTVLCPIEPHGARDEGGVAPLKLFEGMAAGRPVIVTELPFQADLVRRHGCGLVVPTADPVALAEAAATLIRERASADAMGRQGRTAVETLYDWRFRVADTVAVLQNLVAGDRMRRGRRGRLRPD